MFILATALLKRFLYILFILWIYIVFSILYIVYTILYEVPDGIYIYIDEKIKYIWNIFFISGNCLKMYIFKNHYNFCQI